MFLEVRRILAEFRDNNSDDDTESTLSRVQIIVYDIISLTRYEKFVLCSVTGD